MPLEKSVDMKLKYYLFPVVAFLFVSCHLMNGKTKDNEASKDNQTQTTSSEKNLSESSSEAPTFLVTTNLGEIKIKLYPQTPSHLQNFEKLVAGGFFNDLLFHRVIENFMIQGGDPDSKNAKENAVLGQGGPGYTIPAEFNDELIHKKGAIAAARQSDQVNPKRASSGSQFYIVQGKTYTDQELTDVENYINQGRRQFLGYSLFNAPQNIAIKNKAQQFQAANNTDSLNFYLQKIENQIIDSFPKIEFKYSEKARNTYKTIGGTPQLDGTYTVFGEVTEGLEIVDAIANVKVGANDKPIEDVVMSIKKL